MNSLGRMAPLTMASLFEFALVWVHILAPFGINVAFAPMLGDEEMMKLHKVGSICCLFVLLSMFLKSDERLD